MASSPGAGLVAELLYAIGCRVQEQVRTSPGNVRRYVDRLRESAVVSVLDLDVTTIDPPGNRDLGRFARFAVDRVRLAYGDAEVEREGDVWDLRLFGRSGHLDFTAIRQGWLREATKAWAATAVGSRSRCPHFESDPSYLPELRAYADDLRREREAMLAAGAADWAVANVARQLDVIVGHIRAHEQTLGRLVGDERAQSTAPRSRCARPASRSRWPSAVGESRAAMADNSAALGRSRRQDSRARLIHLGGPALAGHRRVPDAQ